MVFVHRFEGKHPEADRIVEGVPGQHRLPLLESGISAAINKVRAIPEVSELPVANRNVILKMAEYMMRSANGMVGTEPTHGMENWWNLYLVGSRATGRHRSRSDVDLLSAGTFYDNLGFPNSGSRPIYDMNRNPLLVMPGFKTERPRVLPSEYNTGLVDRKYIVRATPLRHVHGLGADALPIDLNVVDLTFKCETIDPEKFENELDVAYWSRQPLPRLPLVQLSVAQATPLRLRP